MEDFFDLYQAHFAELERRFGEILTRHELEALVIHSGSIRPRREADDQFWPFLPVPHFAQWTPLAHPECALVIAPGKKPLLLRFVDPSFWERRPEPEHQGWKMPFEIVELAAPEKARAHLPSGRAALIAEPGCALAASFAAERVNPPSLTADLDRQRARKTAYEVACVGEANQRAAAGQQQIARAFVDQNLTELQLHLAYLAITEQDDWETPYKNIVATGPNAATLHHVAYRRRSHPDAASALLLDAGATVAGYASDVSRTHVRGSGDAADLFRGFVGAIDAMQKKLCAEVRVGLDYEELHDRSHREMAAIFVESGLCKLSVDEMVAGGITRAFYPHGLGHSLGLQAHDPGCAVRAPRAENPFLRNTSPVSEGQIFTIEPGMYFIRDLLGPIHEGPHAASVDWDMVENLWRFGGIRIEDDLAVTAQGVRNLTREALKG